MTDEHVLRDGCSGGDTGMGAWGARAPRRIRCPQVPLLTGNAFILTTDLIIEYAVVSFYVASKCLDLTCLVPPQMAPIELRHCVENVMAGLEAEASNFRD